MVMLRGHANLLMQAAELLLGVIVWSIMCQGLAQNFVPRSLEGPLGTARWGDGLVQRANLPTYIAVKPYNWSKAGK